jgi:hypothetical protein
LARNTPVFLLLVDMRFVRKPIDPIELIEVPLVVLALMFLNVIQELRQREGGRRKLVPSIVVGVL